MRKPKLNRLSACNAQASVREKRTTDEIIVDAYGAEERAMGWYYYLEEKLEFPFKARCVASRTISPLEERQEKRSIRNVTPTLALPRRGGGCREKKGEEVVVIAMAREDDCMREMFVLTRFAGRKLGVPLSQLKVLQTGRETREAVEDWQYWVAMGYEF